MTIPEASQLVMQAGAMGKGGEIYVLDMGEPVKIIDLAKDLIRLSGFSPEDVDIVVTGIRPGEKLFEELYFDEERTLPTPHPKLRVAYHRPYSVDEVVSLLEEVRPVLHDEEPAAFIRRLRRLVPEFAGDAQSSPDEAAVLPTEPVRPSAALFARDPSRN
jgi:FlaA1/EpsC-like NDP-sugar epimerase